MTLRTDLHLHSCLSPCGSLDNSPSALVERASTLGIEVAALTDHNTGGNCEPFLACCEAAGILGIAGLEVTTVEEVHILCLFPDLLVAQNFERWLWEDLPRYPHDPVGFGDQAKVNKDDEILELVDFYLGAASPRGVEEIAQHCLDLQGLAIPAHIDRRSMSLGANLGFVPDFPFSALEVLHLPPGLQTSGHVLMRNSDTHRLEEMGRRGSFVEMPTRSFAGLAAAIARGDLRDAPPVTSPTNSD